MSEFLLSILVLMLCLMAALGVAIIMGAPPPRRKDEEDQ